jgi:hypothetical protein
VKVLRESNHRGRSAFRWRRANLVIFPGSALPYKEEWQATANRLPANAVLIVLPSHSTPQKESLLVLAKLLAADGHQVRVVPEAEAIRTPQSKQAHRSRDTSDG